ncbi:MAG: YrrC family ATP-dependent DNA helicase [Arsenophonus sp. NEOnobi-MAG3]
MFNYILLEIVHENSQFQSPQFIEGVVERVTFHSERSSFFVIRAKDSAHKDLITVTGVIPILLLLGNILNVWVPLA